MCTLSIVRFSILKTKSIRRTIWYQNLDCRNHPNNRLWWIYLRVRVMLFSTRLATDIYNATFPAELWYTRPQYEHIWYMVNGMRLCAGILYKYCVLYTYVFYISTRTYSAAKLSNAMTTDMNDWRFWTTVRAMHTKLHRVLMIICIKRVVGIKLLPC